MVSPEATQTLVERCSMRLHALLDKSGVSAHPLERVRFVAHELQMPSITVEAVLSGRVEWSMAQLAAICSHFGQRPGFFLDPDVDLQIPLDTKKVTSVDGGEPIVWRNPRGMGSSHNTNGRLQYITTIQDGLFTREPVPAALIFSEIAHSQLEDNISRLGRSGYVLREESGRLTAAICSSITPSHVHFERLPHHPGSNLIVPLRKSAGAKAPLVIGEVIGAAHFL